MNYRTLIPALLLPVITTAQLRHGPRLGLSIATQTAGQFLQWQGLPKFGPIAGWSLDIPYTDNLHILVEPMIMSKGFWTQNAAQQLNTFGTYRYLELPVLAKLDLDGTKGGYFLTGGPIYGYWLSGRVREFRNGEKIKDITFDLSQPNVRRGQWNVAVGLGRAGDRWDWEVRAQTSVTPFDRLVRAQQLVFGIHLTYRLPSAEEREKKRRKGDGDE